MDLLPSTEHKFNLKFIFSLVKEIPKNLKDTETTARILLTLFPRGGVIEKILFSNKDKREREQVANFIVDLANQFTTLKEESINLEFFKSDEYYCIFKKILEKISFEYKQEKIKMFRNFLLNCSRKDKPKINFSYYLNKIDHLEIEHFEIIKWYYQHEFTTGGIGSAYDNTKKEELPKISKYYVNLENDLNNIGFLSLVQVDAYQNHRYMLSHTGKEFFEFIYYDEPLE